PVRPAEWCVHRCRAFIRCTRHLDAIHRPSAFHVAGVEDRRRTLGDGPIARHANAKPGGDDGEDACAYPWTWRSDSESLRHLRPPWFRAFGSPYFERQRSRILEIPRLARTEQ